MKTRPATNQPTQTLDRFKAHRLPSRQRTRIKGGDGDCPPDDGNGVIGVEDIVGT